MTGRLLVVKYILSYNDEIHIMHYVKRAKFLYRNFNHNLIRAVSVQRITRTALAYRWQRLFYIHGLTSFSS